MPRLSCPNCLNSFQISDELLARTLRCTRCHHDFPGNAAAGVDGGAALAEGGVPTVASSASRAVPAMASGGSPHMIALLVVTVLGGGALVLGLFVAVGGGAWWLYSHRSGGAKPVASAKSPMPPAPPAAPNH